MITSERFKFTDPVLFAKGTPYRAFAALRKESPVSWHAVANNPKDGFWLVTKHADIAYISKTPAIFSSEFGNLISDLPPPRLRVGEVRMATEQMSLRDPPAHARHRQLMTPCFVPRAVEEMRLQIHAAVTRVLDQTTAKPHCDFARDIALAVPVSILFGEMLGVPESDWPKLVEWSEQITAIDDPTIARPNGMLRALEELYSYAVRIARERRARPTKDLVSFLIKARLPDGSQLTDDDFSLLWFPLIIAAFDTTASTMVGGMLALMEWPAEYKRLVDDPSLIPSAVEEMLRWVSPVVYLRRTALIDTELGGVTIRKGEKVVLCYPSGNRDEEEFMNPDVFDISRSPNDHLTFGYGPHFCIGAPLARFQLRILFEELLRRVKRIELDGPVTRIQSFWMNRIRSMPVRIVT